MTIGDGAATGGAATALRRQMLTNLSARLDAPAPLRPGALALAPLVRVRPFEAIGEVRLEIAETDPEPDAPNAQGGARILLEPGRRLIGFENPVRPGAGPLRHYADLDASTGGDALLAIDPAAIREVAGDLGPGETLRFRARATIRQEGGDTARPPSQMIEIGFEIARATWSAEAIEVVLDLDPEAAFPAGAGEAGAAPRLVPVGKVRVFGEAGTSLVQPLPALLEITDAPTTGDREARRTALVLAPAGAEPVAPPDGAAPGAAGQAEVVLAAAEDGRAVIEREVYLVCGEGWTAEPQIERQLALSARLRARTGALIAASNDAEIALRPPEGRLGLAGELFERDTLLERVHLDLAGKDVLGERFVAAPLLELADLDARGAPAVSAMRLRLTLQGELPPMRTMPVRLSAEIADATGAGAGLLRIMVAAGGREEVADAPVELGRGRRVLELRLLLPQSERLLKQALQDAYHPDAPVGLRLRVETGQRGAMEDRVADAPALVVERPIRFRRRERPTLVIDFGARSIAAAVAAPGEGVRLLALGDGRGAPPELAPSAVALSERDADRTSVAPETLWAHAPDAGFQIEPKDAAVAMGRAYVTTLPAPRSAERLYDAALIRLAAESAPLDGEVWAAGAEAPVREVRSERALSDALAEFADRQLAATPHAAECDGARLVLIHPARFGARRRRGLLRAAEPLMRRLGLDPQRDAPILTPSSDAVAAFALDQLPADGRSRIRALIYDLGAASLSLSLADADRIAPEHGSGTGLARITAHGGADVGGDSIDLAIYFAIHAALRQLTPAAHGARYLRDLTAEDDAEARRAKRSVAEAIRTAKAALSKQCRRASGAGLYHWPEDAPFEVQIGASGRDADRWPVEIEAAGPLSETGEAALGDGLKLLRRDGALILSMPKTAVATPAMTRLISFLTDEAVRRAFDNPTGKPHAEADYLIISGRAALWPLIWEGLARTLTQGGVATGFGFAQPFDDALMKTAAARGALSRMADMLALREQGGDADLLDQTPPVHYALLVSGIGADGGERFQQLVPQEDFPSLRGYSGHMRLVEAPRALRVDALNREPWTRALLAPTGIGGDPRELGLGSGAPAPRLIPPGGPGDLPELRIGDATLPEDGSWFGHAPALHLSQLDVTEADAPPGVDGTDGGNAPS